MGKRRKPSDMSLEHCPEIVDVNYVAFLFKISTVQVRNLCKSGELPHFMIGKMYRFTRQDIIRFVYRDNIPENLKGGAYCG